MRVYVFPLGNVVFYPSISKPLNVFEPRYVQMVRDSIAQGVPIALAYVDDPDQEYVYQYGSPLSFVRPIAGYGHPLILEERPDGSLLVFLQGRGKVRLGTAVDLKTPYIACEAEPIVENHLMQNSNDVVQEFTTINKVLVKWLETHIPEPNNRDQFLRNIRSAEEVIGCFASYLVADHDMQQLLLESDDINEKIHLVSGLIASGEIV
ncbi:MAG: LON peptidase substrate-binding domain-containing protein [Pseudobdellovibrionaceae bacterium]